MRVHHFERFHTSVEVDIHVGYMGLLQNKSANDAFVCTDT